MTRRDNPRHESFYRDVTRLDPNRHDMTGHNNPRRESVYRDWTRLDRTRPDKTRRDGTTQDKNHYQPVIDCTGHAARGTSRTTEGGTAMGTPGVGAYKPCHYCGGVKPEGETFCCKECRDRWHEWYEQGGD